MAQENIKVKLPKAGIECEILPYVKHKLAKQVNKAYLKGQEFEMDANNTEDRKMRVSAETSVDVADVKVLGLLEVFGGKKRPEISQDDLDNLEEDDYDILNDAVGAVFAKYEKDNSPKKSASGSRNTSAS